MGTGFARKKRAYKYMLMSGLQKELERLSAENKSLKEDPTSVVGQFISQFNDVVTQNQRLSALVCAFLDKNGGTFTIERSGIESFKGKRLKINLNTVDNVAVEEAQEYIFSYTAEDSSPASSEIKPCVDPECTQPKDFPHEHAPE